jgi:hypothetical protein
MADPTPVSLKLTIPGDTRFLVTVRGVTERVARYFGGSEDEASRLGEVVDTVIAAAIDQDSKDAAGEIDIRFAGRGSGLEIQIGFHSESAGGVERALRATGRTFDTMSRLVDRVEFGRSGGGDFCRLTRNFPEAT